MSGLPELHALGGLNFRDILEFRGYRGDELAGEGIIEARQSLTPLLIEHLSYE